MHPKSHEYSVLFTTSWGEQDFSQMDEGLVARLNLAPLTLDEPRQRTQLRRLTYTMEAVGLNCEGFRSCCRKELMKCPLVYTPHFAASRFDLDQYARLNVNICLESQDGSVTTYHTLTPQTIGWWLHIDGFTIQSCCLLIPSEYHSDWFPRYCITTCGNQIVI